MYEIYEKISYLKGLADGLEFEKNSGEGKLLVAMIDVMEEMIDAIDDNFEYCEDLEDYISFIDEDLSDVEDELFEYEYEDLFDEEDFCDCCGEFEEEEIEE